MPKSLTAGLPKEASRPEVSRENQDPLSARSTLMGYSQQQKHSLTTPADRLAQPLENFEKPRLLHNNMVKELDKMALLIDNRNEEQAKAFNLTQRPSQQASEKFSGYLLPDSLRRTTQ